MSSCRSWPFRSCCLSLCLALGAMSAHGQGTGASAASGAAGTAEAAKALSDSERAKRDADKVFQWIKFHAEKGEPKKPEAKPDAKPDARPDTRTAARPVMTPVSRKSDPEPTAVPPAPVRAAALTTAAPAPASEAARTAFAPPEPASVPDSPAADVVALAAPAPSVPMSSTATRLPPPEPVRPPEEEQSSLTLVKRVDPEYPRALLSAQRNGAVTVRFIVQPDGSVDDVEATRSPDRRLSAAAIGAVKQWRFAPITKARSVSVEIGFQVD